VIERKNLVAALFLAALASALPAAAQSTPSMNLEGSGLIAFGDPVCSATSCNGNFRAIVSGVLGQGVQNINFDLKFEVPVVPSGSHASPPAAIAEAAARKTRKPTIAQEIQALQSEVAALQSQVAAMQSNPAPTLVPGCFPAYGSGTSADGIYTISFEGQYCGGLNPLGIQILSGPIIITSAPSTSSNQQPWASGTLVASGLPKCCGGDFPNLSNEIIVSIVGAQGEENEGP
jgi:hypothetical protein